MPAIRHDRLSITVRAEDEQATEISLYLAKYSEDENLSLSVMTEEGPLIARDGVVIDARPAMRKVLHKINESQNRVGGGI